ncbi:MAG: hypothetical protein IKK39_11990 [Thermoguttaceae bacterium]|nr:hypothetical protein [Thermoguttaceae bacterium]MBR4104768.1 hypothetical protein [Thermoguttaceae bacterium]
MEIKKASEIPGRPVDISEWNDDVKAFVKTFTFAEQLEFERRVRDFNDASKSNEERLEAAFLATAMSLVDENGAPLLNENDREPWFAADYSPVVRIIKAARKDPRAFAWEESEENGI